MRRDIKYIFQTHRTDDDELARLKSRKRLLPLGAPRDRSCGARRRRDSRDDDVLLVYMYMLVWSGVLGACLCVRVVLRIYRVFISGARTANKIVYDDGSTADDDRRRCGGRRAFIAAV